MPAKRCRIRRSVCFYTHILLSCLILCAVFAPNRAEAILHPLDGGGNFHSSVDVVNRWVSEDQLDVMVLIEVNNADLKFEAEDGRFVGRVRVEVTLESLDGQVVTRKRQIRTPAMSEADTGARTQFQVFGILLKDVKFSEGRISCGVYDVNRRKQGVLNSAHNNNASSECSTAWVVEKDPRPGSGVALEEPLFLMQAPLDAWNPATVNSQAEESDWLHDYMHPSRRYGLQQDHLQIFQPVWPQAGGIALDYEPAGLRVEVVNLDMDFALRDTVHFDDRGRQALAAGRPAALFYSLDVNLLPEGAYLLNMAPLDGQGRGSLTRFDVIWRLEALGKHRGMVLGEGHTVFSGRELKKFLASSPAEQEKLLEDFWDAMNPDLESPVNQAYLEFQYRLAYVQKFLGGFGEFGAQDDRGEVFLLLGPADEIQTKHMPMNFRDQDDARIKVYQSLAPDRDGTTAKGGSIGGTQNINPYEAVGGVPMPYSHSAERDRGNIVYSATHNFPFELWKYENGGNPLFPSRFSDRGLHPRFLFIDQTGQGEYKLESSNVVQADE
ncbi:MAG: GWxTD domain-containing protein [Candidatus Krumholzibacteria bacterium]|nr:GWxTD domain-containing protein [Candidatus Krumholzibacteria bacterium]